MRSLATRATSWSLLIRDSSAWTPAASSKVAPLSCAALWLLSLALLLVLLLVEPLRAMLVLGARRARGVSLDDGDGGAAAASDAPSFSGVCLPATDVRLAMLAARLKAPPDPPGDDAAAAPLPVIVLTLLRDEFRAWPLDAAGDAAPLIALKTLSWSTCDFCAEVRRHGNRQTRLHDQSYIGGGEKWA